jgi:hypothetical protein
MRNQDAHAHCAMVAITSTVSLGSRGKACLASGERSARAIEPDDTVLRLMSAGCRGQTPLQLRSAVPTCAVASFVSSEDDNTTRCA